MKKIILSILSIILIGVLSSQIIEPPTPEWLNGVWSFSQNDFSFYYYFGSDSSFKKVNNSGYAEEEGSYQLDSDAGNHWFWIKFYDKNGNFIKRFRVTYANSSPYHDSYSTPWRKMIIVKDGYREYPRTMWKKVIDLHLTPPRKKGVDDKIIDLIFGDEK